MKGESKMPQPCIEDKFSRFVTLMELSSQMNGNQLGERTQLVTAGAALLQTIEEQIDKWLEEFANLTLTPP